MRSFFMFFLMSYGCWTAFFDPHNHISGILNPVDYAAIKKVINEESATIEELSNLWTGIIRSVDEKFKQNPRIAIGALNTLTCDEPNSALKNHLKSSPEYRKIIIENIERVLSATPITGFDSAYALRKRVREKIIYNNLSGDKLRETQNDLKRAIIFRLAQQGIKLAEMSVSFIGGDQSNSRLVDILEYQKIINDLLSEKTSLANQKLKKKLEEKKLPIPRLYWLLMTHTSELGRQNKFSDELVYDYRYGKCSFLPKVLTTSPERDLYKILSEQNEILGTDTAGVESTCFTDEGMKSLKELISTVYKVALLRRKQDAQAPKMVVRIHVGEGAPIVVDEVAKNQAEACFDMRRLPLIKTAPDGKPLHLVEGRKNIAKLLKLIKEIKKEVKDIDKFIVFRFGHVTSISQAQAKILKQLNIEVDVNLSSNIATGSWPLPRSVRKKISKEHRVPTHVLEYFLNGDITKAPELFALHPLKWLLYNNVLTILGSDGPGVEHSNMEREYRMADALIKYWNKNDRNFRKKHISIKQLINNQNKHIKYVGYRENGNKTVFTLDYQ